MSPMTSQPNTGAYQEIQFTSLCHPRLLPLFQSAYHAIPANQCVPIPFMYLPSYYQVLPSLYVCKIIKGTCHVISGNPRSFQDPPPQTF